MRSELLIRRLSREDIRNCIRWARALRSGKYTQYRNGLHSPFDEGAHCVLGVAQEIGIAEELVLDYGEGPRISTYGVKGKGLFRKAFKCGTPVSRVWHLNDMGGWSFGELAYLLDYLVVYPDIHTYTFDEVVFFAKVWAMKYPPLKVAIK
jgi:hypothetical protein